MWYHLFTEIAFVTTEPSVRGRISPTHRQELMMFLFLGSCHVTLSCSTHDWFYLFSQVQLSVKRSNCVLWRMDTAEIIVKCQRLSNQPIWIEWVQSGLELQKTYFWRLFSEMDYSDGKFCKKKINEVESFKKEQWKNSTNRIKLLYLEKKGRSEGKRFPQIFLTSISINSVHSLSFRDIFNQIEQPRNKWTQWIPWWWPTDNAAVGRVCRGGGDF